MSTKVNFGIPVAIFLAALVSVSVDVKAQQPTRVITKVTLGPCNKLKIEGTAPANALTNLQLNLPSPPFQQGAFLGVFTFRADAQGKWEVTITSNNGDFPNGPYTAIAWNPQVAGDGTYWSFTINECTLNFTGSGPLVVD